MTFPFTITQEIRDTLQAHIDYVSAGQKWLLKNDPDSYNEQALLEEIQDAVRQAAELHFGDDEDALEEFYDEIGLDQIGGGDWYDIIQADMETA